MEGSVKKRLNPDLPVLTSYNQDHLSRIALPLGGIGTGTVSLGGRGDLRDWEIMNRPAKGFAPRDSFFALYAKEPGKGPVTRGLEGLLEPPYEGMLGSTEPNHGLPRFRNCSFHAAYPFGQILLSDPDVPVDVRLEAFNPLVPGDADASGIPVAVLRFVVRNKTDRTIQASVCGTVQNFIGTDGTHGAPDDNVNTFREASGLGGIFMRSRGVPSHSEFFGTMALATPARAGVSHRTAWSDAYWGHALLDFWDDFSRDGTVTQRKRSRNVSGPRGSLAVKNTIPARGEKAFTFLLTWHFPNRRGWPADPYSPKHGPRGKAPKDRIGNYYATRYRDAWDVAGRTLPALCKLESQTVAFVKSFCESDLPAEVKEAALYNVSTLRTQTCFRSEAGKLYAWEGCCDRSGCCNGTCTHVWNYEQATAFLFGDLALTMREVEFIDGTRDDGHMDFRPGHLLSDPGQFNWAAADGQMGCIMKLYRDWQLSGDEQVLRRYWPRARKVLEFCWIPKGWDADQDGVMEGAQHHTLDTEYFGPNPLCAGWYLGALRAAEDMAGYLGDRECAAKCRRLFRSGSEWIDENLFNGEYYEQQIIPPGKASNVADGLVADVQGVDYQDPSFQLGAGCLVDQLAGQFMAHVCGLGYLFKRSHIRKTLRSIFKYNRRENMFGHLNYRNSFVLNDESAMLIAVYPHGGRPKVPVPGQGDVMTGFEYAAAVHMLQEGLTKQGLTCIQDIRDRYDGRRRSPFNEAECGHHYGRAMASWAAVTTLTGFRYSAVTGSMSFAATDGPSTFFWSNGRAWGTLTQRPTRSGTRVELKVLFGRLELKKLELTGKGTAEFRRPRRLTTGQALSASCSGSEHRPEELGADRIAGDGERS